MDRGNQMMDETDQAIDRAKKVGFQTFSVSDSVTYPASSSTEK